MNDVRNLFSKQSDINSNSNFDYDKSYLIVDEVDVLLSKEILGQPHCYGFILQDELIYNIID